MNEKFERIPTESVDYLTGIPDKESFDAIVTDAIERIPEEFSIAELDIDYFKHINDTYGPELADEFLNEFHKACTDILRGTDMVIARRSGDEFFIVLPGANTEPKLHGACTRLQKELDDLGFEASIGGVLHKKKLSREEMETICRIRLKANKRQRLLDTYPEEVREEIAPALDLLEEKGIIPRHLEALAGLRKEENLKISSSYK